MTLEEVLNSDARRLLALLARCGELTSSELAARSGIPERDVAALTDLLVTAGALHVDAEIVRLRSNSMLLVGVSLGRDGVSAALTTLRGGLLAYHTRGDGGDGSSLLVLDGIESMIREALRHNCADADRLVGIGVGIRGATDAALVRQLQRRLDCPVVFDHRANLGALAEHWWGAGGDGIDVSYVDVAREISAGHVVRGRIVRGATRSARALGQWDTTSPVPGADIARLARAVATMADASRPDTVVIGGQLGTSCDVVMRACQKALRRRHPQATVARSALGDAAIPVGAAALVLDAALGSAQGEGVVGEGARTVVPGWLPRAANLGSSPRRSGVARAGRRG